ncbi:MAG: hypothetical protein AAF567_03270 [Actinomycetota bacterium]
MTETFNEPIELVNNAGNRTAFLSNQTGDFTVGGDGRDGDMFLLDSNGRRAIHLNGNAGKIRLGTRGNEGDVAVQDSEGRDVFIASGNHATCYIGARGNEGDLFIRDTEGRNALQFNGHLANLRVGARNNAGEVWVNDGQGGFAIMANGAGAQLSVGARNNAGEIFVRNAANQTTVRIDGQAGDIELLGADCAEDFDIRGAPVNPGTVMVIADDGRLTPCASAYDCRVAGVVSGAGEFAPGVRLDRQSGKAGRQPVALVGKVAALVDARQQTIEIGDLLTTSDRVGHAMKANDRDRAFGATIGKALGRLDGGVGLVPVLVALQ